MNFSTSLKLYNINKIGQIIENYSFLYFGFGFNKKATIAIGYIFDFHGQSKKMSLFPAFNIGLKLKNRVNNDIDQYLNYN